MRTGLVFEQGRWDAMPCRIWEVPYGSGIRAYDFEVDWDAIEHAQQNAPKNPPQELPSRLMIWEVPCDLPGTRAYEFTVDWDAVDRAVEAYRWEQKLLRDSSFPIHDLSDYPWMQWEQENGGTS